MARRNLPDFQWEYNEKTEKYKTESEYENFSIRIGSPYQWGSGWTESESKSFHDDVIPKLKDAGFSNINMGGNGVSPTIKGRKPFDKTDIYLHPMEFSGYAKKEDVDKILKVLENCDIQNVHFFEVNYRKSVNAMSDLEYKHLLIENTANIARWIEKMEERGYKSWEMGETFAEYFRIPRVGDKSCLSSGDVDWAFVEDLYKIKEKLDQMREEKMEDIEEDSDREM